jgi:hypothetical protein
MKITFISLGIAFNKLYIKITSIIVFDSTLQVSVICLAALPVGAARIILLLVDLKISIIAFVMVVLPTPVLPVITLNLERTAVFIAEICVSL